MRTCRLLLTLLSFSLATCQAAEITLEPSKDNTIYEDSTNLSNGQGIHLFSGATANRIVRRALLAFEVDGSVPAGATITEATLGMRVNKVPRSAVTNDMSLHRVLQDWGEGTSDAPGQEGRGGPASQGDATWEESIRGSSDWNQPGGDFVDEASSTTSVGGLGVYTWDSTDLMISDVQLWLDDPEMNFGWILLGDESISRTAKRFSSRQTSRTTNRPKLTIQYELMTLAGDYDGDGELLVADIDILCGAINGGGNAEEFDVDGNGIVDLADLTMWVQDLAGTFIGDLDLNGKVDFTDFLGLSASFGQEGNWAKGDFNCDGLVQFSDFLGLSENFGKQAEQQQAGTLASVPEPSALTILFPAILCACLRRRNLRS